ncbi:hypothetical protein R3P38DRAFT_2883489, partial [Favolaschia claudopus]
MLNTYGNWVSGAGPDGWGFPPQTAARGFPLAAEAHCVLHHAPNVPLQCPLCPESKSGNRKTIWNIILIFTSLLSIQYQVKNPPDVPPQFWIDTWVQHVEEQAL